MHGEETPADYSSADASRTHIATPCAQATGEHDVYIFLCTFLYTTPLAPASVDRGRDRRQRLPPPWDVPIARRIQADATRGLS